MEGPLARQVLINSIGPGGYKIRCSIVTPEEPSKVNFTNIMTKLEEHLSPRVNEVVEQLCFMNCVQTEKAVNC